jgi:hypothetical protein
MYETMFSESKDNKEIRNMCNHRTQSQILIKEAFLTRPFFPKNAGELLLRFIILRRYLDET